MNCRYFFFLLRERVGTLPPARRASDRPIAIACLRLVTFLPERPLRSVPALRSSIARFTFAPAFFPYRLAMQNLRVGARSLVESRAAECQRTRGARVGMRSQSPRAVSDSRAVRAGH